LASLTEIKSAARKAAFARRKVAHELGQGTAGYLSEVLAGHRGVPTAGYMAMRTEIDPTAAMEEAAAHGPVGVPVVLGEGQPLKFRSWSPGCTMVPGEFGAAIPETGDWIVPEIVIVPLVAFDSNGGRLGYGGGFYDRMLSDPIWADKLTIGIVFEYARLPQLPRDTWDVPLDGICTESGLFFKKA